MAHFLRFRAPRHSPTSRNWAPRIPYNRRKGHSLWVIRVLEGNRSQRCPLLSRSWWRITHLLLGLIRLLLCLLGCFKIAEMVCSRFVDLMIENSGVTREETEAGDTMIPLVTVQSAESRGSTAKLWVPLKCNRCRVCTIAACELCWARTSRNR